MTITFVFFNDDFILQFIRSEFSTRGIQDHSFFPHVVPLKVITGVIAMWSLGSFVEHTFQIFVYQMGDRIFFKVSIANEFVAISSRFQSSIESEVLIWFDEVTWGYDKKITLIDSWGIHASF